MSAITYTTAASDPELDAAYLPQFMREQSRTVMD